MLLQPRERVFRCYAQHDHGLLSGVAALAWRGAEGKPLPFEAVVAIGLHDMGWIDADAGPVLDPERGRPHDFMSLPTTQRVAIYSAGIDQIERVLPYAGLLASKHFAAFVEPAHAPGFAAAEAARQSRLSAQLGVDPACLATHFAVLRALDLLSLVACLSPPGSDPDEYPTWIGLPMRVDGRTYAVAWEGERLVVDPFPFATPVHGVVAYRDIPRAHYADQAALGSAWRDALVGEHAISIVPPA